MIYRQRDSKDATEDPLVTAGKLLASAEELLRLDWCEVCGADPGECGYCLGALQDGRRKDWQAEYGRWERARARDQRSVLGIKPEAMKCNRLP